MDLRDAISYHQLVVASEGRTEATQRQYLHFTNVFLRYLDSRSIPPALDALTAANVAHGALERVKKRAVDEGEVEPFSGGDPKP